MKKQVKLQNVVMQMEQDANFLSYSELICKSTDWRTPFVYDPQKGCHILEQYKISDFMTYYNCLQVTRWKTYTNATNFCIKLKIKGRISIEVYEIYRNSKNVNFSTLVNEVYECSEPMEVTVPIPETNKDLVGFKMIALSDVELYSANYSAEVEESEIRHVKLSLVTTTFKKQEYIKKNIAMMKKRIICDNSDLKGHIFIHVIDNERALNPEDYDCEDLKIYPNKNVGGAGGFTRGMIEAMNLEDRATHVLLMDDDVMLAPESVFRTYYLLSIVKDEYKDSFVSGAMFDYDIRERQYEDVGYVHEKDASYGPLKPALDMRNLSGILENEEYFGKTEENSYAGWWFCCIPVAQIDKNGLPLPVFVRGDDVEFSLRNDTGFITLNGICIWHIGFAGKFNAALELYQVHRNSFIIQAASGICPDITFIKRIKNFFWKEITRFGYNNAELLIDSVDDFMKGPEWLMSLDGEQSLKEHAAKNEKLIPLTEYKEWPHLLRDDPYVYWGLPRWKKFLFIITINCHLCPDFILRKWPEAINYDWHYSPGKYFRRKYIVAINVNERTGYMRTMNRKRCFALIKRYNKVMKNYKKNYDKVAAQYREKFSEMTTEEFWRRYLGI